MLVEIRNLQLRYDQRKTDGISNINLNIHSGKTLGLIGPSGAGKSTLLKCLGNLVRYQSGEIIYHGDLNISYVDQNPKLDEEKDVFTNLESELLAIEEPEKRANQIRSTLALLEITNEIHSPIKNISGGQRQRVIMAKALVKNPTLLLLDEPFANLDRSLRTQLLEELFDLFKQKNITVVWVTHNTDEAMAYSDELALLNYGELQQLASPKEMYFRPKNTFTATFLSEVNLIAGKLINVSSDEITIKIFNEEFILAKPKDFVSSSSEDVLAILRPEHLILIHDGKYKAAILKKIFKGERTLLEIQFQDKILFMSIASTEVPVGEMVRFNLKTEHIHCLGEV